MLLCKTSKEITHRTSSHTLIIARAVWLMLISIISVLLASPPSSRYRWVSGVIEFDLFSELDPVFLSRLNAFVLKM